MQPGDGPSQGAEGVAALVTDVAGSLRKYLDSLTLGERGKAYAAAAAAVAARLDDPETPPSSVAPLVREFRESLERVDQVAAVKAGRDRVDDLKERRAKRVAS